MKRASRKPNSGPAPAAAPSEKRLLHELHVHQVELEMQNEELRRVQLEVAESRDRYQNLYDLAPTAYVTLDPSGRILEGNRNAAALLGVRALVKRPLASFLSERDADVFHREHLEAARGRRSFEVELRRQGARPIPVRVDILPSKRPAIGRVSLCALIDLSEVRAYEIKLRRMAFDATLQEQRERQKIATELHDRIGQALAAARMKLAAIRPDVRRPAREALASTEHLLGQIIEDTRTLIFEISPPILHDLGLGAALDWLAENMAAQHRLRVELHATKIPKLRDEIATVLFRCVRELLINVAKHAGTSRADVTVRVHGGNLDVTVEDKGIGFTETRMHAHAAYGLFSVREQMTHLGGSFDIESTLGRGTVARIRLPLAARPKRT